MGDTGEDAARRLEAEVDALLRWAGQLDERTVGHRGSTEDVRVPASVRDVASVAGPSPSADR